MKFLSITTILLLVVSAVLLSAAAVKEDQQEKDMVGKTALCIGCTRGIGEAAARQLAERGANVVLTGRSLDAGTKIANDIGGTFLQCDMSDRDQLEKAFESTIEKYGGLDAVFSNGGYEGEMEPLDKVSKESIERIGQVNGMAVLYVYDLAVKAFIKSGRGGILVFNGSIAAFVPEVLSSTIPAVGLAYYSGTKAIPGAMTRASAMLPEAHNIRIFTIAPAVYDTKMVRNILESGFADQMGIHEPNLWAGFNPVFAGCAGDPNDAAAVAVAMLANATQWPPSSVVATDGPLTFESNALSDGLGRAENFWSNIDVSKLRDTVGNPVTITKEEIAAMVAECAGPGTETEL